MLHPRGRKPFVNRGRGTLIASSREKKKRRRLKPPGSQLLVCYCLTVRDDVLIHSGTRTARIQDQEKLADFLAVR